MINHEFAITWGIWYEHASKAHDELFAIKLKFLFDQTTSQIEKVSRISAAEIRLSFFKGALHGLIDGNRDILSHWERTALMKAISRL